MFCQFCGAQNPEGTTICSACGKPIAAPPTVAPTSAVAPEPTASRAPDAPLARMGDRFLAVVLDTIVFVAVFAATGMALAARLGGMTDSGFSLEGRPALLAICATSLVALCYCWLLEGLFGATLGKGMIGIHVRKRDGSACDLWSSFIRNIVRLIDGIAIYLVGFLVAILSQSRQRLGDHLAGTIVAEKRVGGVLRAGLVLLWVLVIGGGFTGAYLMHQEPAATMVASAPVSATPEQPSQEPAAPPAIPSPAVNLSTTGTLRAVNFDFLQSKGGPSRPPSPYRPGDTVHVRYDIVDYSTDSQGRPRLSYDVAVFDPAGLWLTDPWKRSFTSKLKSGAPVHGTFSLDLPRAVPVGTCRFVLKVRDELNSDKLELTAPFQVDADPIAPADCLEVRDFRLSLSKGGPAVDIPELHGGGTVYMSCSVFGPTFRDDKADVQMAMKILSPSGKVVFEKPDYERIQGSWIYHPPTFHVPITGHLSIPSGLERGVYTIIYIFTDNFANNTVSKEGKFNVQ